MARVPNKQLGIGEVKIPPLAKEYIRDILKSKRLTYGKYSSEFEKRFAKIHQLKHAIFCNSGTSALQVSLHTLKKKYRWNDGDEIIVPALTFVATINVVLHNNLNPVFVDVEPDFYEIDPGKIEEKITQKTRAIIPVHLAGHPCDIEKVVEIAKKFKLIILEDSCESLFTRYKGKFVGTFGDISAFSTYAVSQLSTGIGGFICTNRGDLAAYARSLINHGRDNIYISIDDDKVDSKDKLARVIEGRFRFGDIGYNYKATEFEAALGLAQLKNWKESVKKRKANGFYLTQGLKDLSSYLMLSKTRKWGEHTYLFYPVIIIDRSVNRRKLVLFLEENMIETRYLFPTISQPIYKEFFGERQSDYPNAKYLSENGFFIGSHTGLAKKDLDFIIHKFHEFFKKN